MSSARPSYLVKNNFDLVRLIAATQVAIYHAWVHFELPMNGVISALGSLPGVPAFFFVSGFLISASYEQNPNLWDYARNRILRIYPALWATFVFSAATALWFVDWPSIGKVLVWAISQVTIFQDYHPTFLRSYGVGVANGSLWTIPIEMSFYVGVPLLYGLAKRIGRLDTLIIIAAICCFTLLYAGMGSFAPETNGYKIFYVLPTTWGVMFLVGVLAQHHFERIRRYVEGKFFYYVVLYIVLVQASRLLHIPLLLKFDGNEIGILVFLGIAGLVLSAAYTKAGLAERLLHQNDFSYAIYVYHMPVVNLLIALQVKSLWSMLLAVAGSLSIAVISWFCVEKPALSLRHHPMLTRQKGLTSS
jgi:peptidoglycan/LPS O-acetylase OafA/YrhL